jgi:hypothetical protein
VIVWSYILHVSKFKHLFLLPQTVAETEEDEPKSGSPDLGYFSSFSTFYENLKPPRVYVLETSLASLEDS